MAIEVYGELVLDRDETVALIRDMIHPDLDAIRLRDARDREDITYSFSDEGIVAECNDLDLHEKKQTMYDSQRVVPDNQGNVSFVQQSLGYDYPYEPYRSHYSSSKKAEEWRDSSQLNNLNIVRAA